MCVCMWSCVCVCVCVCASIWGLISHPGMGNAFAHNTVVKCTAAIRRESAGDRSKNAPPPLLRPPRPTGFQTHGKPESITSPLKAEQLEPKAKCLHAHNAGMDKESVRKAEVGWSPRGSKGEAGTVLQSGLSSAIYQSIANTAAHKIKDGPPLATKVDHEYLKPLEVRFVWMHMPALYAYMCTQDIVRAHARRASIGYAHALRMHSYRRRARTHRTGVAEGAAGGRTAAAPTIVSCR